MLLLVSLYTITHPLFPYLNICYNTSILKRILKENIEGNTLILMCYVYDTINIFNT